MSDELSEKPIPPRYWWLKRLSIAGGCLLVALVALRLWWGWEANRRLQAEIDNYIAAGEPIYPEDFDPEPIPDELNAAKLLIDAAQALNLTPQQSSLVQDVASDPAIIHEYARTGASAFRLGD